MYKYRIVTSAVLKELEDLLNDGWKIDRMDVVGEFAIYVMSIEKP